MIRCDPLITKTLVERFDTEPYSDFFSQMIKLSRARYLLYRRQSLQENMCWKARNEIYKIYMFLHRSDLNILANSRRFFLAFSTIENRLEMLKSSIFPRC